LNKVCGGRPEQRRLKIATGKNRVGPREEVVTVKKTPQEARKKKWGGRRKAGDSAGKSTPGKGEGMPWRQLGGEKRLKRRNSSRTGVPPLLCGAVNARKSVAYRKKGGGGKKG